ncbi:Ferrochelatase [Frankliniella fusca]|uniref:Ferrochelatase n=1 Tax=Frankliniella fusca TaxID=407009 RepID=A0AAE1HBB0_9NEOP|nr:Ferrochelatase [Frankliniella fusca]
MQLSQELLVWERYLLEKTLAARVALWIWRKLVLVVPVWLGLALARVCLSRSVPEFLATLVGLLPQYSAGTAAFLLARRTARLAALTRRVRLLTEATEQEEEEVRVAAVGYAARMRFVRRAFIYYVSMGMCLIVTQQLRVGPVAPTVGEQGEHVVQVLVLLNETVKWTYHSVSYFALWATIVTWLLALNGLFDVLQRRAARARGLSLVLAATRLHREVLDVQADLKDATFQPLLHVLAGSLAVPLINTYQARRLATAEAIDEP